ncbi:MAG: type I-U CRISPR-associated helicase/endonuclease Cas3 [Thermoplasmatales archaeon]
MKVDDFIPFFKEIHGVEPFPWQVRLLREVSTNGWPETISLPTSSGKTSVIDIAIFSLALQADLIPEMRSAPVRITYVVDRRIIVDEAYDRSVRIKSCLEDSMSGNRVLALIANNLRKLNGGEGKGVFDIVRLRGGLPREDSFIRDPLKPTVILSTVDQVGSRLLFSGYGVSNSMRPIHAALVGVDNLIILDEAHISQQFSQTLAEVKKYQSEKWSAVRTAKPLKFVEMTATPSKTTGSVFSLDGSDMENSTLKKRIECSKPAELVAIKSDNSSDGKDYLSKNMAFKSKELMEELSKRAEYPIVIGIVANTVSTARFIFSYLKSFEGYDVVLLTGRNRSYERDLLIKEYFPRIRVGRKPTSNEKSLFVVSTQTIEVGADIDFDGLVTEAAPIDALQQRFGRLNRIGNNTFSRGIIMREVSGKQIPKDYVYGEATSETWKWLEKNATKMKHRMSIDMGILAFDKIRPDYESMKKLVSPNPPSPILMPSHMDLLVQTFPPPEIRPYVPFYLHGIGTQPEDVQVIWRADIPAYVKAGQYSDVILAVASIPPAEGEAISIPVGALRSFLYNQESLVIADIEGNGTPERISSKTNGKYVLRWGGPDESEILQDPADISPGDVIVIPSSYGGLDRFGWNPREQNPVKDIAEIVRNIERRNTVMRFSKSLVKQWFKPEASENEKLAADIIDRAIAKYLADEDIYDICDEMLDCIVNLAGLNDEFLDILSKLKTNYKVEVYPDSVSPWGFVFVSSDSGEALEFTDDDDSSSLIRPIGLLEHSIDVSKIAQKFASNAGLGQNFKFDLALSGKLHDIGKADPRFQAWLRGGVTSNNDDELLAKSGELIANDFVSIKRARESSGFPRGLRHESYSAAMIRSNKNLVAEAHDKDLVLYLVGTHHGRGRPLHNSVKDQGIEEINFDFDNEPVHFVGVHGMDRIDSGWPELFWGLTRKYGYWGLAYLETLVRLADHKASSSYTGRN